jgi:CHASE3 domain sensor protein
MLHKLSIRSQLIIGFGVILLLLFFVSLSSTIMSFIAQSNSENTYQQLQLAETGRKLQYWIYDTDHESDNFMFAENEKESSDSLANYQKSLQTAARIEADLRSFPLNSEESSALDTYDKALSQYKQKNQAAFELAKQGLSKVRM